MPFASFYQAVSCHNNICRRRIKGLKAIKPHIIIIPRCTILIIPACSAWKKSIGIYDNIILFLRNRSQKLGFSHTHTLGHIFQLFGKFPGLLILFSLKAVIVPAQIIIFLYQSVMLSLQSIQLGPYTFFRFQRSCVVILIFFYRKCKQHT